MAIPKVSIYIGSILNIKGGQYPLNMPHKALLTAAVQPQSHHCCILHNFAGLRCLALIELFADYLARIM